MPLLESFNLKFDSEHEAACRRLAQNLGVTLVLDSTEAKGRFLLTHDNQGRLGLSDLKADSSQPYFPNIKTRQKNQGIDPLMRAIGYRASAVLDCTGGWGTDAAHIAANGIPVTALEQHPVVHALVEHALERCDNEKIKQHLRWLQGNSIEYLETINEPVDVIYIDPMYPPRPGSAAPKKPLQLLQALLTQDRQDHVTLLNLARLKASRRVVVKRPHYADPLLPGKTGATEGKLVRFDIYPAAS